MDPSFAAALAAAQQAAPGFDAQPADGGASAAPEGAQEGAAPSEGTEAAPAAAEGKEGAAKAKEKPAAAKAKEEPEPETEEGDEQEAAGRSVGEAVIHERAKLRETFSKKAKALEATYAQKEQQIQGAIAKLRPLHEAAMAVEAGDFEGIAKALAAYAGIDTVKSWDDLQQEALKSAANPAYRETRKLRQEMEQQKAQQARQQHEAQQRYQQQQRAQQEGAYLNQIEEDLSEDIDQALADLLDVRPNIKNDIYQHIARHYQSTGGEVLPNRDAAEGWLKLVHQDVQQWQDYFERNKDSALVKKIAASFQKPNGTAGRNGENGTASRNGADREGTASRNGVRKGRRPAISQTRTSEASAAGRLSDEELIRHHAKRIESMLAAEQTS